MSTTFTLTTGQMVTRAYRLIGALTPPWQPTADQMNEGIIALNLMLKGMQADGINLFRQTQLSLTVGAMQGLPTTIGTPISSVTNAASISRYACNSSVTPTSANRSSASMASTARPDDAKCRVW